MASRRAADGERIRPLGVVTDPAVRLLAGSFDPRDRRLPGPADHAERFRPRHVRAPAVVQAELVDQIRAGGDIVTAPAYVTDRRTLGRYGEGRRVREWTEAAVRVTRQAVDEALSGADAGEADDRLQGRVLVAGPLGLGEAAEERGTEADRAQAGVLGDAGVDLVLVEPRSSAGHSLQAARAVAETGLRSWVCVAVGDDAERMRSGEPLARVLEELEELAVELVLMVSDRATEITAALEETRRLTRLPIGGLLSSAVDPVDVSGEWLERGAVVAGLLDGATRDRLMHMRGALDAHQEASDLEIRERLASWRSLLAKAAEQAPGGDALWLGAPGDESAPSGFGWTWATVGDLAHLTRDRFRLVVSPDPRTSLGALGAVLERGGWLLARRSSDAAELRPGDMDIQELSDDAWGQLILARRR